MARYIDADELLKDLCTVSAPTPSESWIVERCIKKVNEQPAADVVPKSEAENYRKIAEHQQSVSMRRYFEIKQLKEELAKAKQEVAREIFKDFTKHKVCTNEEDFKVLADLKKKYTEGKNG